MPCPAGGAWQPYTVTKARVQVRAALLAKNCSVGIPSISALECPEFCQIVGPLTLMSSPGDPNEAPEGVIEQGGTSAVEPKGHFSINLAFSQAGQDPGLSSRTLDDTSVSTVNKEKQPKDVERSTKHDTADPHPKAFLKSGDLGLTWPKTGNPQLHYSTASSSRENGLLVKENWAQNSRLGRLDSREEFQYSWISGHSHLARDLLVPQVEPLLKRGGPSPRLLRQRPDRSNFPLVESGGGPCPSSLSQERVCPSVSTCSLQGTSGCHRVQKPPAG